jgi:hypothetical protein
MILLFTLAQHFDFLPQHSQFFSFVLEARFVSNLQAFPMSSSVASLSPPRAEVPEVSNK